MFNIYMLLLLFNLHISGVKNIYKKNTCKSPNYEQNKKKIILEFVEILKFHLNA